MSARREREDALSEWFRTHHGVVSSSRLHVLGFGASAVQRMLARGTLRRVLPGAYCSAAHPIGPAQRMAAVCAVDPLAAVGFATAGRRWGYRGVVDERVHILVPHGHSPSWPGVVVHRCRSIAPGDVAAECDDGIRYTSPPRTLVDCAAALGVEGTESVVEQVLRDGAIALPTIAATAARLARPGRPGAQIVRHVLASRPVWRHAARSELERSFRAAIEHAGLPEPLVNEVVVLPSGERIEVDLWWPAWMLVGEVDHPFWHDGAAQARRDKSRDRKLLAIGIETVRFTDVDVADGIGESLDDLAAVLVRRGWRPC